MEHSPRQHQHQCNEEREASFKKHKTFRCRVARLRNSNLPLIDETKLTLGATQHMTILFNVFFVEGGGGSPGPGSLSSILCSEAPVQCCYESAPLW